MFIGEFRAESFIELFNGGQSFHPVKTAEFAFQRNNVVGFLITKA